MYPSQSYFSGLSSSCQLLWRQCNSVATTLKLLVDGSSFVAAMLAGDQEMRSDAMRALEVCMTGLQIRRGGADCIVCLNCIFSGLCCRLALIHIST